MSIMILFIESMIQVFNIQEKTDWIIYNSYIQRDLELCKLLIDQELQNTKDNNEFAFYILVINRLNIRKLWKEAWILILLRIIWYIWKKYFNCSIDLLDELHRHYIDLCSRDWYTEKKVKLKILIGVSIDIMLWIRCV